MHLFINTVFLYTVIFYAMISQQNSSAILVCYFRLGENVADIFTVKLLFFNFPNCVPELEFSNFDFQH